MNSWARLATRCWWASPLLPGIPKHHLIILKLLWNPNFPCNVTAWLWNPSNSKALNIKCKNSEKSSLQYPQANLKLTQCERSHGRRKGGQKIWNLTFSYQIFTKKIVIFVSSGQNEILPLFPPPPWKNIFSYVWKNPLLAPPGNNPSDAHERSMLCLSQGTVYWLQTLLAWCDNNAVFINDVSRVYANSLPQMISKT